MADDFYGKAASLEDLLKMLQKLKEDGHDMSEIWWGFDDGSLNTETISIDSVYYDRPKT